MNYNKISVVIPVKNRLNLLERALTSVINQTTKNLEILVIDNGSDKDQNPMNLDLMQDARVVYLEANQGNANTARNTGVQAATGEYIAFLDSDDEWEPNHLSSCVLEMTLSKADLVYGGCEINNGERVWEMKSWQKPNHQSMLLFYFEGGTAPTPSLFGTSAAIKTVLWDEYLNRHQDYDFCIQFSQQYTIAYKSEVTVVVHWDKNQKRGMLKADIERFVRKHNIDTNQQLHNHYFLKAMRDIAWIDEETKRYVIKQAWKYPRFSSYVAYIEAFSVKTRIKEFCFRVYFIIRILL